MGVITSAFLNVPESSRKQAAGLPLRPLTNLLVLAEVNANGNDDSSTRKSSLKLNLQLGLFIAYIFACPSPEYLPSAFISLSNRISSVHAPGALHRTKIHSPVTFAALVVLQ
ncbi:hypothetical protein BDR06DRAFT_1006640 [Suillus hirtellus]|nr:hypothetical protein BDR06DRAFT_1006640 [Suillus hirtellus]